MLAVYHKISLVERVVLNALAMRASPRDICAFGDCSVIVLGTRRSTFVFFSFHPHFLFVENRSGGIYLSGQTSNPANPRHLRIDPSIGIGRSFSEFRTCCVG